MNLKEFNQNNLKKELTNKIMKLLEKEKNFDDKLEKLAIENIIEKVKRSKENSTIVL